MASEISEPVRRFIAEHIHSATQLEVLLLLRSGRDRAWSVDEVSKAQVSAPLMVEVLLQDLDGRGFLRRHGRSGRYAYRPPRGVEAVIDELADAYALRRVAVVRLIFSKPPGGVSARTHLG